MAAAHQAQHQAGGVSFDQAVQDLCDTFNVDDQKMFGLASELLKQGFCCLPVSQLSMHLFAAISNAASTSDEKSWSFVADQEHVLIASLDNWIGDALSDVLIDFFGSLQRNIVGQVFPNGLTDEQGAYLKANNGIGLNRCCLSRNPPQQKVLEYCQKNPNRDAVQMRQSVLKMQQGAASFHQDIQPQVFTMLATLDGEDTKYLPKPIVDFAASIGCELFPGMPGEAALPTKHFNIWMGQSMPDLLRGLGADSECVQSLLLMHRAPNDELQPERITLISTAVRMQLD